MNSWEKVGIMVLIKLSTKSIWVSLSFVVYSPIDPISKIIGNMEKNNQKAIDDAK
jgi:hypothetical protein